MFKMYDQFMNDENAAVGADIIGRIIGVVFGIYVVAYALGPSLLALVNTSGFVATSPILPILTVLVPIIVTIGIGWMFYKHMSVK